MVNFDFIILKKQFCYHYMLLSFKDTRVVKCIKRPSSSIKSPYVADVLLNDETIVVHTPALGMGGYVEKDKLIVIQPIVNPKGQCKYSVVAAYDDMSDAYIGANPLHANKIFHECCNLDYFNHIFGKITKIKTEPKYENGRFDFQLNENIMVEVKSTLIKNDNKGIFPYGKLKNGTISERANKHLYHLAELVKQNKQCYIFFIVLRNDVDCFSPNTNDKEFLKAFNYAVANGVKPFAFQMKVSIEGIEFCKQLDIII